MSQDLITCPNCGLSQSARHSFCARCDLAFDPLLAGAAAGGDATPSGQTTSSPGNTPSPTPATPVSARRVPAAAPLAASPATAPRPSVDQTQESDDEAPFGPSWNMPHRPDAAGTVRTPASGTVRRAAPGAPAGRSSFSGRRAESLPPEPAVPAGSETDEVVLAMARQAEPARNAASASAPVAAAPASGPDDSVPPAPRTLSSPGRRHTSGPAAELRGRPPSSLYADEQSVPPEDPLMAALVSGEISRPPGQALPQGTTLETDEPPRRRTDPQALRAAAARMSDPLGSPDLDTGDNPRPSLPSDPERPRVVPPSPSRRLSTNARRRDPRGRAVATHPNELEAQRAGGAERTPSQPFGAAPPSPAPLPPPPPPAASPAAAAVPLAAAASARPVGSRGAQAGSVPGGVAGSGAPPGAAASLPGSAPRGPAPAPIPTAFPPLGSVLRSAPGSEIPIPPPPSLAGVRGGVDVKRGLMFVGAAGLLVLIGVAGLDGLRMIRDLGHLQGVLDRGIGPNGPTPDLPEELDGEVRRLGLGAQVKDRYAEISASRDEYRVGVEVSQGIVGVPVRYTAKRSGGFVVEQKLATLAFFVKGGWELDEEARNLKGKYEEQRGLK